MTCVCAERRERPLHRLNAPRQSETVATDGARAALRCATRATARIDLGRRCRWVHAYQRRRVGAAHSKRECLWPGNPSLATQQKLGHTRPEAAPQRCARACFRLGLHEASDRRISFSLLPACQLVQSRPVQRPMHSLEQHCHSPRVRTQETLPEHSTHSGRTQTHTTAQERAARRNSACACLRTPRRQPQPWTPTSSKMIPSSRWRSRCRLQR